MKKYFKLIMLALIVFVLAGCGKKNQLTCTATAEESGVKITGEVVADFDAADKLTDAVITYIIDDDDMATTYCNLFKLIEDKEKGIEVICKGHKITVTGYANMDSEDEEDTGLLGNSKEEFITYMTTAEGMAFTCK